MEIFWLYLSRFTNLSAFVAALFSVWTWLGTRRLRDARRLVEERRRAPITIKLRCGSRELDLPYKPRRDQFSRQELAGLLSFYYGRSRFDPLIMRKVLESGELNQILDYDRPDASIHEVLVVDVDDEFLSTVLSEIERLKDLALESAAELSPDAVESERKSRIWNLTPHEIHYVDGDNRRSIPSDGSLRLRQFDQAEAPIDGLPTVTTHYGEPEGVPNEIKPGDILIVSTLVGDHWDKSRRPPEITLLVPDTGTTSHRDKAGRIVAVTQFIRK